MKELPFRQIHLDFHTSPYIQDTGCLFNADEFIRTLRDAHVNSINLFAKCHHGMYYYDTKIGTRHPALTFDLFGAQVEACKAAGIRAIAYTCVAWNEDWADRHPEWLQVTPNGVLGGKLPFGSQYYAWRSLCLNNMRYREVLKAEIKEIHENYHPDGYWIDIVIQRSCICPQCQQSMLKSGLDPSCENDRLRHDRLVEIGFAKEFYQYIKQLDPDSGIFFNSFAHNFDLADDPALSVTAKHPHFSYIDIESLPSEEWGYTHFPISASYLNARQHEITMMNGKFHMSWGDFGSIRNLPALSYECFRALAYGAKVCVGDQLHPSGQLDKTVYDRVGTIFAEIEAKEPWCARTEKVSQIGVFVTNSVLCGSQMDADLSVEGVFRILTRYGHQFDLIDFESKLDKYELIILPDTVKLPEEMAEKLNRYVAGGGKLLVTANSGLDVSGKRFVLDGMGVEYLGPAEFTPRYMRLEQAHFPDIPQMDYVAYEMGAGIKAVGAKVLSYTVNPYFNRTYQRFSSHRQTPPRLEPSDEPAITMGKDICYISNPIFMDYAESGQLVFAQLACACIQKLLPKPLTITGLPSTGLVTLRRQGKNYIVHLLDYIIERRCKKLDTIDECPAHRNLPVSIKTNENPRNVSLIPQNSALEYEYADGYVKCIVPQMQGHQMILIEM